MRNRMRVKVPVELLIWSFIFQGVTGLWVSNCYAEKFSSEVERDFPIRSMGRLQLTNVKGDIRVQGWAFDKIRVRISKEAFAESQEKANELFEGIDYRYAASSGGIELSSQYGKKLNIEDRLKHRENPQVRMDISVLAPSYLNLKIWSAGGRVFIKNWNANTEVRAGEGALQVEGLNSNKLTIQCTACTADLKEIRSSIHYLGGAGKVSLEDAKGKFIYVETTSGAQKLAQIQGNQLYVSQKGSIDGQFLTGKVEFRARDASIAFRELSGFLSGVADSGNVTVSVRDWKATDSALIETGKGNIQLTLPQSLSANADIWSMAGTTSLEFPFVKNSDLPAFGPEPVSHFIGRIGDGGELLRIFSASGNVTVLKGRF